MLNKDQYYHDICKAVAKDSRCLRRKIGAVLVSRISGKIVAKGCNSPPSMVPPCGTQRLDAENAGSLLWWELNKKFCQRETEIGFRYIRQNCPRIILNYPTNQGLHLCYAVHAERACLLNAARQGVSTVDTILYTACEIPCKDCLIELLYAGITQIVVEHLRYYNVPSKSVVALSGLDVREFDLEGTTNAT